ncbi:MAG: LacI family DNA-binding transcriptional regulator [Streptosporangiaceae bacterium]|nr:LacI family DNA-binding transcriptional regulator [Streptosporangiaceae bacterium]MBV9858133.1 LacI family DNA-binding transcriptional regulator [Streptosporangiaceae bacterium]
MAVPVDGGQTAGGSPADGGVPGNGIADGGVPDGGTADGASAVGASADGGSAPTIYDVARVAGVSIASVSRVLNGRRNPRPETRDRVLRAVSELGFAPDGAARALSARLKETVGVIVRRPLVPAGAPDGDDGAFADEAESLQFPDMLNRGIERAAQRRGFDLLVRTVDVDDHDPGQRIVALARKSDGLILHDRVLDPHHLQRLSRQVPVVTLAGIASETTANVHSDNRAGMVALARHLLRDHGYRTLGYLGGYGDSPDSLARHEALEAEVARAGAVLHSGPQWQGNYYAAGGAAVTERLLASGTTLPRVIVCANDQTALGVMYALRRRGVDVPGEVAVTGFDDIPMARHLHPQLTTVRQPIGELGETAFEVLYSMINHERPAERDVVLPARLMCRESCGCHISGQVSET